MIRTLVNLAWLLGGLVALVVVAVVGLVLLGWLFGAPDETRDVRCPACGKPRVVVRDFASGWVRMVACDGVRTGVPGCVSALVETHSKGGERVVELTAEAARELEQIDAETAEARVAKINLWRPGGMSARDVEAAVMGR